MKRINDEGDLDHPAGYVQQEPQPERRPAVKQKAAPGKEFRKSLTRKNIPLPKEFKERLDLGSSNP